MLCVLAFHQKDQDQAERLAVWMRDLGGCKGHELLLGIDTGVTSQRNAIQCYFDQSFDKVTVLPIANPYNEWATAANFAFSTCARHIESNQLAKSWLWLEGDVVPICAGWLDALEAEFKAGRKPFMGDFVNVNDVPEHCSGIAIYPGEMTKWAGLALISHEIPWDVQAAAQILPHMHRTKLISHAWKHPAFKDQSEVDNLLAANPEMVLFHSSKDGSLIDLLRARTNLPGAVGAASSETEKPKQDVTSRGQRVSPAPISVSQSGEMPGPGHPVTDLLIKSYPKDYEFLSYCLRAIDKFASGFRQVVIIIPADAGEPKLPLNTGWTLNPRPNRFTIMRTSENGDGYLMQQAVKANAHEFTDADYVLHLDSDCILTQPITPESFFHEGKPIWYMTKYSEIDAPWKPYTEKFLGEPVEYEFMRRLPMCLPIQLHRALSAFCLAHHKMRLTDYILSQPNREFSEFNALGALAYTRARDDFHWIDTTKV